MAKVINHSNATLRFGKIKLEAGVNELPASCLTNSDLKAEVKRGRVTIVGETVQQTDIVTIKTDAPKPKSKTKKSKKKVKEPELVEVSTDEHTPEAD